MFRLRFDRRLVVFPTPSIGREPKEKVYPPHRNRIETAMNESISIQHHDKELEILRNIYRHEEIHQRDIAEIVGLSLGMTNAIMKRLAVKGFLTVRKVNNRNIMYAVSPSGVEEIAKRSYKYFKRTIKNIVFYKNSIEILVKDVRKEGYEKVVLIGESDVDFIVEHLCHKYGLKYAHAKKTPNDEKDVFLLLSENMTERGSPSLRDILFPV